jgi:hypothetical protein
LASHDSQAPIQQAGPPDFWPGCGYRLLEKTGEGRLVVTDDYLRIY